MLAQMVWGTFLEKNCPSSNGHILDFWGSKRLPGWFGALIYCHNGDFTSFLKLAPECPVECGGGVQSLIVQCPNVGSNKLNGSSLIQACRYTCVLYVLEVTAASS